jgi:hypothetical protein
LVAIAGSTPQREVYKFKSITSEVLVNADNIYWKSEGPWPLGDVTRHPHPAAPRCAPCGYDGNLTLLTDKTLKDLFFPSKDGTNGRFIPPLGCPCTPKLLCQSHPFFNASGSSEKSGTAKASLATDPTSEPAPDRSTCSLPRY